PGPPPAGEPFPADARVEPPLRRGEGGAITPPGEQLGRVGERLEYALGRRRDLDAFDDAARHRCRPLIRLTGIGITTESLAHARLRIRRMTSSCGDSFARSRDIAPPIRRFGATARDRARRADVVPRDAGGGGRPGRERARVSIPRDGSYESPAPARQPLGGAARHAA